ncbi:MAG: hypothetical protein JNL40_06285 [Cyclobacteriaceae bacterium]|nr:hypothetical protein [Cyclobacteriaceae bacterium]
MKKNSLLKSKKQIQTAITEAVNRSLGNLAIKSRSGKLKKAVEKATAKLAKAARKELKKMNRATGDIKKLAKKAARPAKLRK